ncbi:MAG: ABC transporter substrate-binding protein [Opitutales bacterium]|jgi:simple sugar transport system substrate-binding protein
MNPTSPSPVKVFKLVLRLSSGLLAALLLHGCSKSAPPPSSASAGNATSAPAAKTITVGFAQTGAESAWRTANTKSMKDEAAKDGIVLKFSDGQGKQENQIAAVRNFIAQGVDVIVIAPVVETGWEPVLREAKAANIPVIDSDRQMAVTDPTLVACFVGSDFNKEGQMVGEWVAEHTGGKGRILEIQGTPGSAPAIDRHQSFADTIAKYPGLTIIDSQSGDFRRVGGKEVMEAFLKKYGRNFDIVYAHNDDMALGAIQAIEEAGLQPGKDVMVVSIDGEKEAVQAVADGKINCVVECNPLTAPLIYGAAQKILAGQPVPAVTYNKDQLFDSTNAAAAVSSRQY